MTITKNQTQCNLE